MPFALFCEDRPDALKLRHEIRTSRLEHLGGMDAKGTLEIAGPSGLAVDSPDA